jgi:uncharacterized protein YqiB (DUF1249 family)
MKQLGILDSVSAENPSAHFVADGFMDLCVEYLGIREVKSGYSVPVISMTHYCEEDEDLIPDPDMEVAICHDLEMVEALTFQNAYVHQEVYREPDLVNVSLKEDLNQLLEDWLDNTKTQGHRLGKIVIAVE